jgi:hypothetical protein
MVKFFNQVEMHIHMVWTGKASQKKALIELLHGVKSDTWQEALSYIQGTGTTSLVTVVIYFFSE